jgi:hypothetical protein
MRYDIVVYEKKTGHVDAITGVSLNDVGFHTVEKRLLTTISRLNDRFDAIAVPTGKYKKGGILPESEARRG